VLHGITIIARTKFLNQNYVPTAEFGHFHFKPPTSEFNVSPDAVAPVEFHCFPCDGGVAKIHAPASSFKNSIRGDHWSNIFNTQSFSVNKALTRPAVTATTPAKRSLESMREFL
jgi:hypothetical protein